MIQRAGFFFLMLMYLPAMGQVKLGIESRDSVTRQASKKYEGATFLTKVLLGSNYRDVWAHPVKVQVFRMSESDFTITQLGGGQQTLSLRMKDKLGREWVLRTLDKDISRLRLPGLIPKSLFIPMAQQLISAGFPYSHNIVYELARTTVIVAARPYLVWVDDDAGLKEHRKIFANRFCVLEQREPTPDDSDTKSTETVLEKITGENDHLVVQKNLLKARLLDMLVADWDRHADQWRWDKVDIGTENYYYGIPRDRDQAFFLSDGVIPKLVQWFGMKQLVGFQKELHLKKMNWKSWTFDRTFLNELGVTEWKDVIKQFQKQVSDTVIERAVKQMPPEIFEMEGQQFIEKLKSRRNALLDAGIEYYRYISQVVVVNGSQENEKFFITSSNGQLTVTGSDASSGRVFYQRSFDDQDTWKIIINGLGGKDVFIMDSSVSSKIRIEISGGAGADTYSIKGDVHTMIRDDKSNENQFDIAGRARKKLTK